MAASSSLALDTLWHRRRLVREEIGLHFINARTGLK